MMTRYRLGILAFMILVLSVMLYANYRFRTNPARTRSDRSLAPDFQLQTLDGKTLRLGYSLEGFNFETSIMYRAVASVRSSASRRWSLMSRGSESGRSRYFASASNA